MNEGSPINRTPGQLPRAPEIAPFRKSDLLRVRKHNEVVARVNPLLNIKLKGGKVTYSDANVVLTPGVFAGGGGAAPGKQYRLKSVQGDYITCRTWDGVNDGDTDVLIAKDPQLRESLASESIFGTTHSYTYSAGPDGNNDYRTDDNGASDQLVCPTWQENQLIYAIAVDHTSVVVAGLELTLLAISPARAWLGPC